MEYAMAKYPDGTLVRRSAALASLEKFQEALAQAGGRAPLHDGEPMLWSELRGWFPRHETRSAA